MTTAEYYRDHKHYEQPFHTQSSALRFLSAGETNSLFLAWALIRDDGTRVDGDDLVDLLPDVPHGEMPEGWES
jgi:hypothetical protein